jgi:hypothetical protein
MSNVEINVQFTLCSIAATNEIQKYFYIRNYSKQYYHRYAYKFTDHRPKLLIKHYRRKYHSVYR